MLSEKDIVGNGTSRGEMGKVLAVNISGHQADDNRQQQALEGCSVA